MPEGVKDILCKLGIHKWVTKYPYNQCEWCGKFEDEVKK